jgi:hypothetical protein
LTSTLIENLYVVRNSDGTVDTEIGIIDTREEDAERISILEGLELDSRELHFDYSQSMN